MHVSVSRERGFGMQLCCVKIKLSQQQQQQPLDKDKKAWCALKPVLLFLSDFYCASCMSNNLRFYGKLSISNSLQKKLFFHASHSIAVNEPAQLKYATVSKARSACCNSDDELLLESLFKSKTRRTNTKHFFSEEHEAMITSRWCSNSQPIIRNCCRRQHMWLCITALLLFCLHFFLTFFSPTTLPRLFFLSDIFCSGAENN